jgi:hypothetical protein
MLDKWRLVPLVDVVDDPQRARVKGLVETWF